MSSYDELTSVEYSSLRVPYETLNRKFRAIQKNLERASFRFSRDNEMFLKKTFREGKECRAELLVQPLAASIAFLNDTTKMATSSIDEEISIVDAMIKRIDFLQYWPSDKDEKDEARNLWDLKRCDRMVCEQLLRYGYIRTAKAFVCESGIGPLVDVEPYEKAQIVICDLREHSLARLHDWINEHRSRLKRIPSQLEQAAWIQEAIECVRSGDRKGALAIVRRHITPSLFKEEKKKAEDEETRDDVVIEAKRRRAGEEELPAQFRQLSGLIALGSHTTIPAFKALLDSARWEALVDLFRSDFKALYQLPEHSAFSVAIQIGLAAHKTPWCTPVGNDERNDMRYIIATEKKTEQIELGEWSATYEMDKDDLCKLKRTEECPCCDPHLFRLAKFLPLAHVANSRIFCSHTRELLNENNPPYALPSGFIYGEKGLMQLERENDSYLCSRSNVIFKQSDAIRLYIL